MKKFLALFLVLVMAFSCVLVSCNNDSKDPIDDEENEEGLIGLGTEAVTTAATTTDDGVIAITTTPSGNNVGSDYIFEDVNETVYVRIDALNVRSEASTADDTWRGTVYFGQSFKRIKRNAAWSLIEYEGNQYYVDSRYVTTDSGSVIFKDDEAESTVYVNVENTLNLRTSTYTADGYNGNIRYAVKRGVALTRIATSTNGNWVKVKYGEDVLYCNTAFVSATVPSEVPVVTQPIVAEG